MLIVSKKSDSIVNLDQVTSVYIGADGYTIKVDFQNGRGCQLGKYDTGKAAGYAMAMMVKTIRAQERMG